MFSQHFALRIVLKLCVCITPINPFFISNFFQSANCKRFARAKLGKQASDTCLLTLTDVEVHRENENLLGLKGGFSP